MHVNARGVTSGAVSHAESEASSYTTNLINFLHFYDVFLTCELSRQHPQFTRDLRQLERQTRFEQEEHSAQILATLQLKDARIYELQTMLTEKRGQLDVLLDEFEQRETKEDKAIQVDKDKRVKDISVQTKELTTKLQSTGTQTDTTIEAENGSFELLAKLEQELKTLEEKNEAMEKQLQLQIPVPENDDKEADDRMEKCLDILQRGVEGMNLSCTTNCIENRKETLSRFPFCVNLDHRLEIQSVQLEHVQECSYLWREAIVQFLNRQKASYTTTEASLPSLLPSISIRYDENDDIRALSCSRALREALYHLRQRFFHAHHPKTCCIDGQNVVKGLARTLAKRKKGVQDAAKIVQEWAGWETQHLHEMRALRQGFAEERAVHLSRRAALLQHIDRFERQEVHFKAELNMWRRKKKSRGKENHIKMQFHSNERAKQASESLLAYPKLVLRLATLEQSLVAKDAQLSAANATIRALSSCAPGSLDTAPSRTSFNRLAVEMQRSSKEKVALLERRERELLTVTQYFEMEKLCLQLQSRLETTQTHVLRLEAAKKVWEQERGELVWKIEKLESEAIVAQITTRPVSGKGIKDLPDTGSDDALFFALKRLHLSESESTMVRERLRQSQEQVLWMKEQLAETFDAEDGSTKDSRPVRGLDTVVKYHQECVREFKKRSSWTCGNDLNSSSTKDRANVLDQETSDELQDEWKLCLRHYESLWIAFAFLYSSVRPLGEKTRVTTDARRLKTSVPVFSAFGFQDEGDSASWTYKSPHTHVTIDELELELFKRDEMILILQKRLLDQAEHVKKYLPDVPFPFSDGENDPVLIPFNPSVESITKTETRQRKATEFEDCKAKCVALTTENQKLMKRLHHVKERNEKVVERHEQLQSELREREKRDCEREREWKSFQDHVNSREQENLTLVQSLCSLKEKYARLEATYEKDVQGKAAEDATRMERAMATISQTLSRLEEDKHRLEAVNVELGLKVHELEREHTEEERKKALSRSSKGTCTEAIVDNKAVSELSDVREEKNEALTTQVDQLKEQLIREKECVELARQTQATMRKKQQEQEQELATWKRKVEVLINWQRKLQQEFQAYQDEHCSLQHQSTRRRIAFLSGSKEDSDEVLPSSPGTRAPLQELAVSRGEERNQQVATFEHEVESEALWWQLRASKLEVYVRSAMDQNDTFEDTIRELETRMKELKLELASRLKQEGQLEAHVATLKSQLEKTKEDATSLADQSAAREKQQQEDSNRTQSQDPRARRAAQRKTELLTHQRAKLAALQHEHEQAVEKLTRLATIEKQAAWFQQRAKTQQQQFLAARQSSERTHQETVDELEKTKARLKHVSTRFNALGAENTRLREQMTECQRNAGKPEDRELILCSNESSRTDHEAVNEQVQALKRRVRQKQQVVDSYKAKIATYEAQVKRQQVMETKLRRSCDDLREKAQQRRQDTSTAAHRAFQERLCALQNQLDGLRASVFDSFQAFLSCRSTASSTSPDTSLSSSESLFCFDEDRVDLVALKRWTDLSAHDLQHLELATLSPYKRQSGRRQSKSLGKQQRREEEAAAAAVLALQEVERALEGTPEDCRAEICTFLQCLCP